MPAPDSASLSTPAAGPSPGPVTRHLRLWLNDRLVDPATASISALDHGITVGDGVFEAFKITAAGAFSVRRHLDRLSRSAAALGLPEPDHALIREAVAATTADRRYDEGKVRVTWTGGAGPLGSQAAAGPPTLIVAADSRVVSDPVGRIVTGPWRRNELGAMTGVKTTSYGENVRGLAYASERGATETIFLNTAGHLCEGTGSNIFCVFGDRVLTPPLGSGPLAGITRELLCEWWPIEEADLTLAEAQQADEVFCSSSLRDVQAVRQWDERTYPAPGPVTARIQAEFAARSAADIDP